THTATSPRTTVDATTRKSMRDAYAATPLRFERASDVEFVARGDGYAVGLAGGNATLVMGLRAEKRAIVEMRLVGAASTATPAARHLLPGVSNYIVGHDPRQWRTGVRSYAEVAYRDVYPGVNVVYYGNQQRLEYDFEVAAGADYRQIEIAFDRT